MFNKSYLLSKSLISFDCDNSVLVNDLYYICFSLFSLDKYSDLVSLNGFVFDDSLDNVTIVDVITSSIPPEIKLFILFDFSKSLSSYTLYFLEYVIINDYCDILYMIIDNCIRLIDRGNGVIRGFFVCSLLNKENTSSLNFDVVSIENKISNVFDKKVKLLAVGSDRSFGFSICRDIIGSVIYFDNFIVDLSYNRVIKDVIGDFFLKLSLD